MTTSTSSDDASSKVLKQIEFYFSDSNFPRDKFLRAEASKDPQGFVNIETIASFNRIKQITTDNDLIVAALRTSPSLEVSEDGKKVRRTTALPTEDPSPKRTIYAVSPSSLILKM
jgi:lupus La protein